MSTTEETVGLAAAQREPQPDQAPSDAGGAHEAGQDGSAAPQRPPKPRLIPPPPHSRQARRLIRMAQWGAAPLDRINRLVLIVLGLVVAAAGVGALLLHEGTISWTEPSTFYGRWSRDAAGSVDLAAAIACAVCLVILVLAAWWALSQFRPVGDRERVSTIRLSRGPRGRTNLAATTLAKAASTDLGNRPGISSARVRVRAVLPTPRIQVTTEMALDADIDDALSEVDGAIGHLLGALGAPREDADVELRLRFARGGRQAGAGHPGRVA